MVAIHVGYYAGLFLAAAIFCVPVLLLAKAIAYRLTGNDERPIVVQVISIVISGALAAAWAGAHASMFADPNSQPLSAALIFVVVAGSAALFTVHAVGLIVVGSFGQLLSVIRGK